MGNNQIAMGNNQIANGISPSPSGEVRWGLDVDMLSNNNFYIKTKANIRSNLFLPFGKVRMGLEARWGLKRLTEFSSRVSIPPLRGRLGGG